MIFGPGNSIIVPYDYLGPDSFQDFESQLEAIREHYRFSKLSQITTSLEKGKRQGFAAIVLENPRKGVFLQAVQVLLSLEIPFTLFVDPDYVGLNRLPLEEELEAYARSYPEKLGESEVQRWTETARSNPNEADTFLRECRKSLGPLRIDEMDSLRFFTTWGKILELSPELVEFGLSVKHEISSAQMLEEKLLFVEKQLKQRPTIIRVSQKELGAKELDVVKSFGFKAVLGHQVSEVTKDTSSFNLPIWRLAPSL
ncbi:MAG: hypothetical protein EBQ92_09480 [Proteobacteria bacterium]|nr:hypothetical protein [Pseudomonadota bacterium]